MARPGVPWRQRVRSMPVWLRVTLATLVPLSMMAFSARYPASDLSYDGLRSTTVLDREGRRVHEFPNRKGGYGSPIHLGDMPPSVILATLSGEDAHFYHHPGIDPVGVARAVALNVRLRRWAYGGSTITQQLAKLVHRRPRTLGGKLREAWDAWRLERTLSKQEILEQYLNRAYYGRNAYGVEAAARRFFGKPARELTLAEGTLLAALPRAPSAYDPERHPEAARKRRAHLLDGMARRGFISEQDAHSAAAAPIELVAQRGQPTLPHAIDLLLNERLLEPGSPDEKLTLDLSLQQRLRQRALAHLERLAPRGATQASLVVLDNQSGDVLAMVGSSDYHDRANAGAVNGAMALRPPGSTLKPFVYALSLQDGAQPSTLLLDVPTSWSGYQPRSLRERYHGQVSLREALGSSLNVPAVRTAQETSPERLAKVLHDVGLRSVHPEGPAGLALALGGTSVRLMDLANAYATLARGGKYLPWRVLLRTPVGEPRQVLSAEAAYLITETLDDETARRREFGFDTPLELPFPVAAKTGTSQAYGDNVVVGYTPTITVAVWVGNFDGRPLQGLLAMEGAAPLWRDALLAAMEGRPPAAFERPTGMSSVEGRATRGLADTVEILSPADGAHFVIDPLVPRQRQRLALRAAVRSPVAQPVRFSVDGVPLSELDVAPSAAGSLASAHWSLAPGAHRFRVEVAGSSVAVSEHEFFVRQPES